MKKLTLYCPKCGEELISKSNVDKKTIYACKKSECNYLLTDDNVIDISFKSKGLAKALSNLCPYPFEFDGVKCSSMEAFIQSLKVRDTKMQEDVCSKTGPFCYSIREMFEDWRDTQTLYWKGEPFNRHSPDYFLLISSAYDALLEQSPIFRYALTEAKTNEYQLIHSIGCNDPSETLLTPVEYTTILEHLIECYID